MRSREKLFSDHGRPSDETRIDKSQASCMEKVRTAHQKESEVMNARATAPGSKDWATKSPRKLARLASIT
jgi:hypothetical protein